MVPNTAVHNPCPHHRVGVTKHIRYIDGGPWLKEVYSVGVFQRDVRARSVYAGLERIEDVSVSERVSISVVTEQADILGTQSGFHFDL
jgi:hypothetical protein